MRVLRYFVRLATFHEDMHAENLTLVLTSLGYAQPAVAPSSPEPVIDETFRLYPPVFGSSSVSCAPLCSHSQRMLTRISPVAMSSIK